MTDLIFNPAITQDSVKTVVQQEAAKEAATPGAFDHYFARARQNDLDTGRTTLTTRMAINGVERLLAASPTGDDAVGGVLRMYGVQQFQPDPDSLPQTADELETYFKSKGIPQDRWEGISKRAVSQAHLDFIISNQQNEFAATDRMQKNGWLGSAGEATAMFFDPAATALTLGSAGVVRGVTGMGVKAFSQGVKEVTKAGKFAAGVGGSAVGGYGVAALEADANDQELTFSHGTSLAAQFVAMHLGMEGIGYAGKRYIQRKKSETEVGMVKDTGVEVHQDKADAAIHGEGHPVSPEFKDSDIPNGKGKRPSDPDLQVEPKAESELADAVKQAKGEPAPAKAEPKAKDTEISTVKSAAKDEHLAEMEAGAGIQEPHNSKLPEGKLYTTKWGRTDSAPINLRFESQLDADMFKLSFEKQATDHAEVLSRVKAAMPELTEKEILDVARDFKATSLRHMVENHPTVDSFDIPAHFEQALEHVRGTAVEKPSMFASKAARAGLVAVGVGAVVTAADNANASVGGVAGAAGAVLQGAAGAAAVIAGKGKKLFVPKTARPQHGSLGDLPFGSRLSERLQNVPLGSEYALIPGLSKSETARFLSDMSLTPLGGKTGRAVQANGADILKDNIVESFMGTVKLERSNALEAWAKSRGIAKVGLDYRNDLIEQFETEATLYKKNPAMNADPALRKYANEVAKREAQALQEFQAVVEAHKAAGTKFEADSPALALAALQADPAYVRLMHNYERARDIASTHGQDRMVEGIGEAIRLKQPTLTVEQANAKAAVFTDIVMRMEADPTLSRMARMDVTETLKELVARGWADKNKSEDILSILQMMQPEGKPGVTQQRLKLDRDYVHRWTDDAGKPQQFAINDLYVNDLSITSGDWIEQLAGNRAFLEASLPHKIDMSSQTVFEAYIHQALQEGATARQIEVLRAARMKIKGDAGHTTVFGEPTAFGATLRLVTAIQMGKLFVASTIPEGIAGLAGAKFAASHRRSMPGLMDTFRTIAGMQPHDPMTRSIMAAMGIGAEGVGSVARHQIEHGIEQRVMRPVQVAASKVFRFNGLVGASNFFKAFHARGVAQFIADITRNGVKVTDEYIAKQLHPLGITREMATELGKLFEKHAKFDSKGILQDMNFNAIQGENPWLSAQFEGAMRKHAKLNASEVPSLGGGTPLMRTELSKVALQFLQPVMVATGRTRRDLGNFGADQAARWALSFVGATGAYMARTYLMYYDDPAELEKRLKTSELMKAGFRNSVFSGFLPQLIDTAFAVTGNRPYFSNQTASGRPGTIAPPAFSLGSQLIGAVSTTAKVATGRPVSKGDVRSALSTVQLGQWWTQPVVNMLANEFPKRLPRPPKAED
ncbi:hypothetical protein [Rhizobacter sp. Root404]|uniref:hypothetical protein n=1 Tax=Rhizobacter sp. Root404 TaxID=1736528 RepID=UPI0006F81479|nr:hypothetical protein [Rhizobacter sp. Root404]KQW36760.1 hypothetical protein ASC76_19175 [Rhizobacter sp. Root404]